METLKIIPSAVLAGIAIAIGGTVYMTVGGTAGAILFSFGLLTVVHYGLHLFTGKSGFFDSWSSLLQLFTLILFGNVAGCWLFSLISPENVTEACVKVTEGRLEAGLFKNFLLAVPCGFIMTTAVEFGRNKQYLPLLFGVPVFILCGFRHSIADAFYYCAAGAYSWDVLWNWLLIVAGNFIGCNAYRALMFKKC